MTIFHMDGFETFGIKSTSAANLETRISATTRTNFQEISGGHNDDIEIIDDESTVGFALQMPETQTARETWIRYEWPTALKATTNASHVDVATGFRLLVADTDPNAIVTVWQFMTSATAGAAKLQVAANGTDLLWADSTGTATISSVLMVDAWSYIEIEFKPSTSGAGGFVKIYVDGVLVYNPGARSVVAFTFLSSWGIRIGVVGAANETGGNTFAFDDVYQVELEGVDHTNVLGLGEMGGVRVLLLSPTSDDTPNDWAPSTGGDNFALIDEQDWDETDYVQAATTADDDHYGVTALSDTDEVHALQIDAVVKATDGTPNLHIGFDDGTDDSTDMGTIGTGSTVMARQIYQDDPSGAQWTESTVNSAEATQRMTE